jgi:hypothetical protein
MEKELEKFRDENGRLNEYAFACGYIEEYGKGKNRVSLSKEASTYHVKGFADGEHFWEVFEDDELDKARTSFDECVKRVKPKPHTHEEESE